MTGADLFSIWTWRVGELILLIVASWQIYGGIRSGKISAFSLGNFSRRKNPGPFYLTFLFWLVTLIVSALFLVGIDVFGLGSEFTQSTMAAANK